jgi:hypothetical protein
LEEERASILPYLSARNWKIDVFILYKSRLAILQALSDNIFNMRKAILILERRIKNG